jgi:hypothetical protein
MKKNDPLQKVASYFWSSTYNAFLFGHGPPTPNLANIHMLTGLKITGQFNTHNLMVKASHRLKSTRIGGWSNYIATHNTTQKNMIEREHVAFLNM